MLACVLTLVIGLVTSFVTNYLNGYSRVISDEPQVGNDEMREIRRSGADGVNGRHGAELSNRKTIDYS